MAKRIAILFVCLAIAATFAIAQQNQSVVPKVQLTAPTAALPSLPVGTPVKMKLETPISTSSSKAGDSFAGRVIEAVSMDGKVVIPVGSSIAGKVVRVEEKRRVKGLPVIEIHPEQVTLPTGEVYTMTAVVADTPGAGTSVDDEGRIKGKGMSGRDKLEIAAGAGGGAGVGALVNGGKGAIIGAAIGGGAAIAYWLTKHKSASLPAGSEIVLELSRPMTLNLASD